MSDRREEGAANAHPEGAGLKEAPSLVEQVKPRSMSEVALNCAGFFVGLLIMTGDYLVAGKWLSAESWAFLASPKALVWIFLVAGQFAFWSSIVEPLWHWRTRLRQEYGLTLTREIRIKQAAAIVFFALPAFFLIHIVPDSNLAHHDLKMALVNLVAMIVALVAVAGIWYVREAFEVAFTGKGAGGRPEGSATESIRVLLDLRADLQRFITLLGAMVALGTLAKGALRQAILATGGHPEAFPADYVLLQGTYFTGLLALVYIPTYTVYSKIGANLVDSLYPIAEPNLDPENLSRWQGNRKGLEELLQLRTGALDNLRASVSILAPVATSVVTVLLGTK
jgi:hypothetical protein